jgi:hypothetical protein
VCPPPRPPWNNLAELLLYIIIKEDREIREKEDAVDWADWVGA